MGEFDDRTQANMDVVLEEICRELPHHGGGHEVRKFIAERLIEAARAGRGTLGDLQAVARRALIEWKNRRSA
jgi:hypothetical protein